MLCAFGFVSALLGETVVVTTVLDEDNGSTGGVSLREAIATAGAGDTIVFDNAVFNGDPSETIHLTATLAVSGKTLTIDATNLTNALGGLAGVVVSGDAGVQGDSSDNVRVFEIDGFSDLTIKRLGIVDGFAPGDLGVGGGILNHGTLTLEGCTLSGNRATASGAIENVGGTLTLIGCTVANNSSGIYNFDGMLNVVSSTISNNGPETQFSGFINDGGIGVLQNSILAGNDGALFEQAGSIVETAPNVLTEDPMLAPLANYGGPLPTMLPLAGSPALNGGSPTADTPTSDQRGLIRVLGNALDLGAYETENPLNYSVWAAETIGLNDSGAIPDPFMDNDSDGSVPLREYAFRLSAANNLDPEEGGVEILPSDNARHLTLRFPRRDDVTDLTYEVRASSSIIGLADGGSHTVVYAYSGGVTTVATGFVSEVSTTNPPVITVADTVEAGGSERRFLQLVIKQIP